MKRVFLSVLALALGCGYGLHDDVTTAGADETETTTLGGTSTSVGGTSTSVGGTSTSVGGSTTATASSTTSPATSTGCNFICDPDGGSLFACDNFAQDCPEGQKCAAYDRDDDGSWDSTQCVDVLGDGQPGEPCTAEPSKTGVDTCAFGAMCWYLDDTLEGLCVPLCTGTLESPTCPPGMACLLSAMSPLNLCFEVCDPTLQDCPAGAICESDLMSGFICYLDASGGMAPPGTPCAFAHVCNAGSFCANPDFAPFDTCQGADGCCTPFCDLNEGDGPCQLLNAEFACVPWYEQGQAPAEFEHVGGCGLPG